MRIMARSNAFLPEMQIDEHSDLREIIFRIASTLRFYSQPVWRRYSDSWRRRLRTAHYSFLRRELRFLLAHSGLRRIVVYYERFFRNNRSGLLIAGEFVREIRMENANVLDDMMSAFSEQIGK